MDNSIVSENQFSKVIRDIMHETLKLNLSHEIAGADVEKSYPSFVTGLMILQGTKDIVLTLTFSKMAAAKIVVSLLGIKYTELTEVGVYDAVMEITNMVSGRMKTVISATGEHYQLTTPFVFAGVDHFIEPRTRPIGTVIKLKDRQFEMLAGIYSM